MRKAKRKNQTNSDDVRNNTPANPNLAGNATTSNTPAVTTPATPLSAGTPPPGNPPANNSNIPIVLALITGVFGLLTAVIALVDPQIFTSFFLRTPVVLTATPIPFAQIESLDVIQAGAIIQTVDPDKAFDLSAGSNVNVRVNLKSNIASEDLVFLWEFCDSVNDVRGQGATEIPYRLRATEQDCITIRIEKGGVFLDAAHFFVTVE